MAVPMRAPGPGPAEPGSGQLRTSIEPSEAPRLVEEVMARLKAEMSHAEARLSHEFECLARHIENARSEMASLRPYDIALHHLPKVVEELDAIAEATENASNSIMAAAESIERLTSGLDGGLAGEIGQLVTTIFEACGFQDISGQRISKVVKTLQRIEDRVTVLVASIDDEIAKQVELHPGAPEERPDYAGEPELLSGPQRGADATNQDEIDRLLKAP